uniref:Uncharacterized protein n=1 Tax=Rhizophora mucronata TaxID=61149 RepID=A0A2P2NVP9_RHIMU
MSRRLVSCMLYNYLLNGFYFACMLILLSCRSLTFWIC